VAHTTQEKISKQELLAAVDTYAQMTLTLLHRAETSAASASSLPKQTHA
jgi:hypothetical protein